MARSCYVIGLAIVLSLIVISIWANNCQRCCDGYSCDPQTRIEQKSVMRSDLRF